MVRNAVLNTWDNRFLTLADHISTWSKDPSTKVGAVIVRDDRTIVSVGYNGFPRLVTDSNARYADRETKLAMVVHAEANAIVNATEPLHGHTIYCTHAPCAGCTGLVIQSGIIRVIAPEPSSEMWDRWGDSFERAFSMMEEAGLCVMLESHA